MGHLSAFRPHRRLALPFVTVFGPLLWFVARDVTATPGPAPVAAIPRYVSLAVLAAVVSYLTVALVVGLLAPRDPSDSRVAEVVFDPSNATLAVFAALVAAGVGYLTLAAFVAVPWWFDLLAAPVGLVVGLPLVVLYGGFVVVANAVPALEGGLAPYVVVALGVACSVLWAYLVASVLSGELRRS